MEVITQRTHFILFINTKSGDGDGKCFITLGCPQLLIRYQSQSEAYLYFVDLYSASSRQQGLQTMKKFMAESIDFRVIICGGDGTIPWVLSEILKEDISLTKVIFGIIPIGTGNDFSRSLGWGTQTVKVSKGNYKDLGMLVKRWMNAKIGSYDMWDVTVQTFQNGKIYDIKDQRQIEREEKSFKKMFSNYVGLGLDARVVYTVERHRTSHAFLNKVAYGLIGCLNFFRRLKKLDEKVDSISDYSSSDFQQNLSEGPLRKQSQKKGESASMLARYPIKRGRCGLVCLNCTSYMAGLRKVWQTKSISNVNIDKSRAKEYFKDQKVDDGLIEFVSFKNELNLALQRIIRSGSKVFQGSGPYQIKMKEPKEAQITHMQIDGESIKILNLKSVLIRKTDKISDHKLRVMVNSEIE